MVKIDKLIKELENTREKVLQKLLVQGKSNVQPSILEVRLSEESRALRKFIQTAKREG